jgi:sugar/nucleoside kinase (ribokinase family)
MTSASRLFCLDSVLVDVVLKVSRLPERAGDVRASGQLITTGGGFNAMSAAARHGMAVVYAGRLGTGPFATLATAALGREGVTAPVERNADLDTGICVVLLQPDGERTFVTSAGAESTLRGNDLTALEVGPEDFVLVSGYNVMYQGLADVVLDWLESLPAATTVAFDPASRMVDVPPDNLAVALEHADWLLCNAAEARQLSGCDDVLAAATALASRRKDRGVVVRDGARGCVVATNPTDVTAVAGFATTVVDTNGAGDVHNGVLLAEIARGQNAHEAARWANAAAAMAIARFGPATGPTRGEVAAWLAGSL